MGRTAAPPPTCPRTGEISSSLSKDRTNICTALPAKIQVLQMYPLELLRQLLSLFVPVRTRTKMFIFLRPLPGPALHSRPSAREKSLITIRVHLPPSAGLCSSNGHPQQALCQYLMLLRLVQRCTLSLQSHSTQEGSNFCNLKTRICLCFCTALWAHSG